MSTGNDPPGVAFHPRMSLRSVSLDRLLFAVLAGVLLSSVIAFLDPAPVERLKMHWGEQRVARTLEWDERGWPMRCLCGGRGDAGGYPLHVWALSAGERWMPLKPMWPGFAVNGVIYTIVVVVLFKLTHTAHGRLRSRLGRCRTCGYRLREEGRCPECGAVNCK